MYQTGLRAGYFDRMPTSVAIGVLAAAIQSGLQFDEIEEMINDGFDEQLGDQLESVFRTFQGLNSCHLWSRGQGDRFKMSQPALLKLNTLWKHSGLRQ